MKITMYELLGLVKDGTTPKKIKFNDSIYEYHDKDHGYCRNYYDNTYVSLDYDYYLFDILNDEVEIIEEPQENKIPEKLDKYADVSGDLAYEWNHAEKKLKDKINEILDYLEKIE